MAPLRTSATTACLTDLMMSFTTAGSMSLPSVAVRIALMMVSTTTVDSGETSPPSTPGEPSGTSMFTFISRALFPSSSLRYWTTYCPPSATFGHVYFGFPAASISLSNAQFIPVSCSSPSVPTTYSLTIAFCVAAAAGVRTLAADICRNCAPPPPSMALLSEPLSAESTTVPEMEELPE